MNTDAQHPALNLMRPTMRKVFVAVAEMGEGSYLEIATSLGIPRQRAVDSAARLIRLELVTWRLPSGNHPNSQTTARLLSLTAAGKSLFDWHDA